MVASSRGYVDIVKKLLQFGADKMKKRTDTGETAHDIAKKNKRKDVIEVLKM